MKIRKITILEITLAFLFCIGYFLQKADIAYFGFGLFVIYMILGILYFPLGFYTLRSAKFSIVYSMLFGLLFGLSLTAIFFSLLKVDISVVLLLWSVVFYLMAAAIQAFSFYFIDKREGQIIMYDLGISIRYIIFFILIVSGLLTYNFR